jgi:predicted Zn finger-like uncharacterized protein
MLIVCPNCATSYMIDPTSVGPAGRMVRCARCKSTWFAGAAKTGVDAFVDGVIAEAEAEQHGGPPPQQQQPAEPAADDFGDRTPPHEPQPPAYAADDFAAPARDREPEPEPESEPMVAITDAPSLVPPVEHAPFVAREPTPAVADEEVETFAARRKRLQSKRKATRKSSRWTAIVLLLFALNVAVVGARNEVVRFLPQTASLFAAIGLPVNLRHLTFENVRITRDVQDGITVLMVDGMIASTSSKPVEVPRLRFAARSAAGQEIYTWTAKPERSLLGPGEKMKFSSRLAAPPADANDVLVRFFTANDAMAGAK